MKTAAVFALAACAAACDRKPPLPVPAATAASAFARLRGTLLVRGDSALVFVACGTTAERPLRVSAASQVATAVTAVNGALRDSVWLEFVGDTTAPVIVAREALYAAPFGEGSRCDAPAPSFDVEATGNEPFWHVTLDSTQLVFERPEPPRELVFDALPPETRGTLTTIRAHRALGRVHDLTLGLLREACRDGMSDAWYPYRAELRVADLALHGCARR